VTTVAQTTQTTQTMQPTQTTPAPAPAPAEPGVSGSPNNSTLYDSKRNVFYVKPKLRGWSHLLCFEASLVIGTLLLSRSDGATRITAVAIYTATVSGLFGVSALYHRGNWTKPLSHILQRVDQAMIFFLIAGTATPAWLLAAPGTFGRVGVVALWALTITATAIHLAWRRAPEELVGATFVGLGCLAGLAIPDVWIHAGVTAAVLMIAGGVLYAVGLVSFHRRWDPYPAVFGFHEVFHLCVCLAAACQYVAIAIFIV
jgi:hemolysin III